MPGDTAGADPGCLMFKLFVYLVRVYHSFTLQETVQGSERAGACLRFPSSFKFWSYPRNLLPLPCCQSF